MNVSYNNLFLIKRLYLIRRARLVCTLSLYRTDRWYFANNKAARTLCKSIYPKSQLVLWPWSKRCQNTLLTLALVLEKILIMSIILSLNFADNRDFLFLANQLSVWLHIPLFAECFERIDACVQGFTSSECFAFSATRFGIYLFIYFPIIRTQ